jgi:hypothetical protein
VFLKDAFEDWGSGRVIPNALGIDHGNGSVLADPQTVGFRAIDASVSAGLLLLAQTSFCEPFLQVIPGGAGDFGRSALGLGLLSTQENVALDLSNSEVAGNFG